MYSDNTRWIEPFWSDFFEPTLHQTPDGLYHKFIPETGLTILRSASREERGRDAEGSVRAPSHGEVIGAFNIYLQLNNLECLSSCSLENHSNTADGTAPRPED